MPLSLMIGDYIDPETGVVTNPLDNTFGDSARVKELLLSYLDYMQLNVFEFDKFSRF
jgi:hypothetical protein